MDPKLTQEIIDDLIYVALNKSPKDYDFIGHKWTCKLLAKYVKQNYNIDVSDNTIRVALKANNLSYKKCESKPTKASKAEQKQFKKNIRRTKYFRVFK